MSIPFHSLAIAVSLFGFYASYIASAALYPGGTWVDKSTVGYSLWQNYFCDIFQTTALNGLPNPGSQYVLVIFGFLLATLLSWWRLLNKFLADYSSRISKVVKIFVFLSFIGVVGVIIFPTALALRSYHFGAVLTATLCGLFASILPLVCFLRIPTYRSLGKMGLLLLSPVVLTLCFFILYHLGLLGLWTRAVIICLQKISFITVSMLFLLSVRKQLQVAAAKAK